jgi:hypothetical protein
MTNALSHAVRLAVTYPAVFISIIFFSPTHIYQEYHLLGYDVV